MDLLLYRIISGITRINVKGETFLIKGVSAYQRYLAEELYYRLLEKYSEQDELKTDNELYWWLLENGYWKEENEKQLKKYKKDLEDFKIKLFELKFQGEEKKKIKGLISEAKLRIVNLIERRHQFDFLSASGAALIAKNKYIIGLSIYTKDEKPLFNYENFWDSDFPLLDGIIVEYNKLDITTEQIRRVARSDSWRKYWCCRESDRIFGKPSIELNEDQLSLISWARIYDNIYQHPDCPEESVIDDDDALDGFLIFDKRKRDREKGLQQAEDLITNDKIAGADEVFLVADNTEDAKRIFDLNSESAKAKIKVRENLINEKGEVKETELPDVALKLRMAVNQRSAELSRQR